MSLRHIIAAMFIIATASCRSTSESASSDRAPLKMPDRINNAKAATAMPKAIIYKTTGDYADNIPITLDPTGTYIISFPAPTDITADSHPIYLANGYLLDRRGITRHSAFTTYTYTDYPFLQQPPTIEELTSAIIAGAKVTEIIELPMTTAEAVADTSKCNRIIRYGLKDCKRIYTTATGMPMRIKTTE